AVASGVPRLLPLPPGTACSDDFVVRPARPRKPQCRLLARAKGEGMPDLWWDRNGANYTFDALPISLDEFGKVVGASLDRPIVDRTGLAGMFDIHLEFSPDGTKLVEENRLARERAGLPPQPEPDRPPTAPSIFTAIQ